LTRRYRARYCAYSAFLNGLQIFDWFDLHII